MGEKSGGGERMESILFSLPLKFTFSLLAVIPSSLGLWKLCVETFLKEVIAFSYTFQFSLSLMWKGIKLYLK